MNYVYTPAGYGEDNCDTGRVCAVSYTHLDVYKRQLMEYTTMVDMIERDNKCYGAIIRKQAGKLEKVTAAYTVMACGGVRCV